MRQIRRRLTALALVLAVVACNPTLCEAARRTLETAEFTYAAAKISTEAVGDAVDALVVRLQECEDLGISTCEGLRAELVRVRAELAKWQGRLVQAGQYLEYAHLAYLRLCPDADQDEAAGRLAALGYRMGPLREVDAALGYRMGPLREVERTYTKADLKELQADIARLSGEITREGGAR